jgi:hypothetical protein
MIDQLDFFKADGKFNELEAVEKTEMLNFALGKRGILLVSKLSYFGKSVSEISDIMNKLLEKDHRIIFFDKN